MSAVSSVGAKLAREGAHVSEMQRRRLLLAIVEVAGDSGLEAATVGRVCQQASVSRRTFYELFEDRQACLLAAFDAQVQSMCEQMRAAFEHGGSWSERLRAALVLLLERLDGESHVARFCLIETPRAGGLLAERHRDVREVLAGAIEQSASRAKQAVLPPPLTAQGVVGGALSVIHGRLLDGSHTLVELTGPLMAMILHPYLGAKVARRELDRPTPSALGPSARAAADPFKGLPIRFTYRTARVLATIAHSPGASNRHVAVSSGIADDGQVSRLLARLARSELIVNHGQGHAKGEPNAWRLTGRGAAIHAAIAQQGA
jgi:AcrR family transcriptional regulator